LNEAVLSSPNLNEVVTICSKFVGIYANDCSLLKCEGNCFNLLK